MIKKAYIKPTMRTVELKQRTPILTGSNYGVSTTLGGMSDTEDSEDVVDEAW